MGDTTKTIDLDHNGDVILIVGSPDETIRLRVSSAVLQNASRTFNVMFGPNFSEGQDPRSPSAPKEIVLTKDGPKVMKIICDFLHHRPEDVPQSLDEATLLKTAQTVDKYFLQEAVGDAAKGWLQLKGDESMEQLAILLQPAALFKESSATQKITKALVLNFSESYYPTVYPNTPGCTQETAAALTCKRDEMKTALIQAVYDMVMKLLGDWVHFDGYLCRLENDLKNHNLEPRDIATLPLSESLANVARIDYPDEVEYDDERDVAWPDEYNNWPPDLEFCYERVRGSRVGLDRDAKRLQDWEGLHESYLEADLS